ncbi:MAG: hypothetical protein QG577_1391 [Thermodesulfobacteriota bacterium]|nr:hypothetical protein [Thermodesulfobacteriota bacterium]
MGKTGGAGKQIMRWVSDRCSQGFPAVRLSLHCCSYPLMTDGGSVSTRPRNGRVESDFEITAAKVLESCGDLFYKKMVYCSY